MTGERTVRTPRLLAGPSAEPDISAAAPLHDVAYWRGHPDVADVELIELATDDGSRFELRLWLSPSAPDPADPDLTLPTFGPKRPSRPCDLQLGGAGELHPYVWERCPGLEHLCLYHEADGDDAQPEGWWAAELWVAGAAA